MYFRDTLAMGILLHGKIMRFEERKQGDIIVLTYIEDIRKNNAILDIKKTICYSYNGLCNR